MSRWLVGRHLLSVWLLAILVAIASSPLAIPIFPESPCNCGCAKSRGSCCCRRSAHHQDPDAPGWSAAAKCVGNCPCTRALPLRSYAPLAPARAHPFVQPPVVGALTSYTLLTAASNPCYLAFLYQRPPPWDML
jgi:hypothetical protein